ncbi:MAG: PH domain-containing protein [Balneolaceae bacterium]
MKKDPTRKLTPRAIRAWQWSAAFGNLFYFAIPGAYLAYFGLEDSFHLWIAGIGVVVIFLLWLSGIVFFPYIRWKRWRYSVDQHEIDLKRGILVVQRTLIPLSRVQHVDTRQGPILRWYKLASVTISTAATTHEIPALDEVIADRVRDTISKYARLAEEDV